MDAKGWAAALAVVLIWGLNFVAAKIGVAAMPPLAFMAVRFLIVGLALAPFFRLRPGQLAGVLAVSTTMGVLHFGLLFVGIKGIDAAAAAIVLQLAVPFSAALAAVFFGERLGSRRGGGMALAFAGVALLAGEPGLPDAGSLILVALAAFAWSASNVLVKRLPSVPPLAMNAWMSLLAAPQLLLLSLLFEHGQMRAFATAGWTGWGALVYTILGASIVAYSLWYYLLGRYELNRVVPFTLLGPVIGVASGVLVLGEALTWYKLAGGVMTIIGVAAIQFAPAGARRAA